MAPFNENDGLMSVTATGRLFSGRAPSQKSSKRELERLRRVTDKLEFCTQASTSIHHFHRQGTTASLNKHKGPLYPCVCEDDKCQNERCRTAKNAKAIISIGEESRKDTILVEDDIIMVSIPTSSKQNTYSDQLTTPSPNDQFTTRGPSDEIHSPNEFPSLSRQASGRINVVADQDAGELSDVVMRRAIVEETAQKTTLRNAPRRQRRRPIWNSDVCVGESPSRFRDKTRAIEIEALYKMKQERYRARTQRMWNSRIRRMQHMVGQSNGCMGQRQMSLEELSSVAELNSSILSDYANSSLDLPTVSTASRTALHRTDSRIVLNGMNSPADLNFQDNLHPQYSAAVWISHFIEKESIKAEDNEPVTPQFGIATPTFDQVNQTEISFYEGSSFTTSDAVSCTKATVNAVVSNEVKVNNRVAITGLSEDVTGDALKCFCEEDMAMQDTELQNLVADPVRMDIDPTYDDSESKYILAIVPLAAGLIQRLKRDAGARRVRRCRRVSEAFMVSVTSRVCDSTIRTVKSIHHVVESTYSRVVNFALVHLQQISMATTLLEEAVSFFFM